MFILYICTYNVKMHVLIIINKVCVCVCFGIVQYS